MMLIKSGDIAVMSGECPRCNKPNSIVVTETRRLKIREDRAEIKMRCVVCDNRLKALVNLKEVARYLDDKDEEGERV